MNWGYKILFVYIIFIAGVLFMVFKASNENQDLVTKDYYEQELKYQEKIDEMERAGKLSASVKYELEQGLLSLTFPPEMTGKVVSAQILLYCTADKHKDINFDRQTETGTIKLPIPEKNKGAHVLKVNWQVAGTTYYYEEKLIIP